MSNSQQQLWTINLELKTKSDYVLTIVGFGMLLSFGFEDMKDGEEERVAKAGADCSSSSKFLFVFTDVMM